MDDFGNAIHWRHIWQGFASLGMNGFVENAGMMSVLYASCCEL